MNYIGIDYGTGTTNCDPKTGIQFGVISQHDIIQAWADSAEPDYGTPQETECPKCDHCSTLEDIEWGDIVTCPKCDEEFEVELPDYAEPIGWFYDDEGYKLSDCLDSDVMVLKSPYYTYCQFCSPCVPGAGNLNNPIEEGVKAYCLDKSWFQDGKAPYPIYSVETNQLVK